MTDDNTIELILKSINIVDIVSSYIPLKKSGSNFKARCPFHDEKSASFMVSEKKQIYKCFGCGKAGNAITFVRDYEKISFYEALKKLAEKAGITLKNDESYKKKNTKRDLLYLMYKLAGDFFIDNLEKYGHNAKRYLEKRQIPLEIAKEFGIGYSLDSYSALKNYLLKNHISEDIFPKSGLFRVKDNNDTYDVFRDRLMFPIHSVTGNIVAFGGRALSQEQEKLGKYMNSPTTDIYIKGKELYGLHITRFEIGKKNSVFVSEGYLDFLRLYEKGIKNAVASLGTALTKEQINLLSRYTKNFFLLYDGDKAGITAAVRASSLIIQNSCVAKIILLPDNHDPDSYLMKYSIDDFMNLQQNALTLTKFVAQHSKIFGGQRQAIQLLLDVSPEIEDPIVRELFIKDISEAFQISEINLRKKIQKQYKKNESQTEQLPLSYKYEEERKLLKLMLKDTYLIKKVAEDLNESYFINDNLRYIYNFIVNISPNELSDNPALILEKIENDELKSELSQLFFEEEFFDEIDDLIRQVKLRKLQEELKEINEKLSKDIENSEYYEKKFFIKKEISKLSKSVVRKTIF
ncbi:MAG: DNA primase [Candidatus Cloacimonetes bacterium]|nr:DNA primase [Candidatus Cloacimonadota bacterium]